jgi:putative SOS response-associated peptidase YedK
MCGRFTKQYTWEQLYELYNLSNQPTSNLQPRYNVCPTDTIDTIVDNGGKRELVPMRWGLVPAWWQKPLKEMKLATFNARAETVTQKPMFREAFKRNRCLIPASGYYEWEDAPTGKQPHYFTRRDGKIVTVAGIWNQWTNKETGKTLKSAAMIITAPNAWTAEVHDRMPVVLEERDFSAWLEQGGTNLLKPAPNDILQRWPVSKRVNSSRADAEDATLISAVT